MALRSFRVAFFGSFVALSLLLGSLVPRASLGDEFYTFVVKKQETKKLSRWSLAEWVESKDRRKMMDMWLALHTPTPFEFILGGAYEFGQIASGEKFTGSEFSFAAYATIFGLEIQRESSPENRMQGLFHLRLFGYNTQGTNITLEAGVRQEKSLTSTIRNGLLGVNMTIALTRFFGVEGLYRHYFHSPPNAAGLDYFGNRCEGGAYIDFNFFRIYGKFFSEKSSYEPSTGRPDGGQSGVVVGTKLFF